MTKPEFVKVCQEYATKILPYRIIIDDWVRDKQVIGYSYQASSPLTQKWVAYVNDEKGEGKFWMCEEEADALDRVAEEIKKRSH